jgi:DNA-binding transcriptional LysR family regulator
VDRRQLDYFVAVAEYLSFTNAAYVLHVAQPSLSQTIKSMERELGVQLFYRLPQGIRLTSAGEALLGPAKQTLRNFTEAADAVAAVAGLSHGRLDIAAPPASAVDPLVPMIARLHARAPGVKIHITHPGLRDIAGVVRSGDSELALAIKPTDTTDLSVLEFPSQEVLVVLPPSAGMAPGETLAVSELEHIDLICVTATRARLVAMLAESNVTPRFSAETAHWETLVPLVLSGVGAALLHAPLSKAVQAQGAVVCRLDPPIMRTDLLVHRPGRLTPAAALLIEVATELVGERSQNPSLLPRRG